MRAFYVFLLFWTRLDLIIARSAPVVNLHHVERLLRDEDEYDRALIDWIWL